MNRSIDGAWHTIKDINFDSIPLNGTSLTADVYNTGDLLKVLRDYKHYFRVRAYYQADSSTRIYGKTEAYTWSDGAENDYVKWGARQISQNEFAAVTSLSMGLSLNNRSAYGVSLTESNIGYNRDINFNNSKPLFVTVSGHLYGYCTAAAMTPTQYGADCAGSFGSLSGAKDHLSTLTITGPSDVTGLYSGQVTILRLAVSSGTGPYKVIYNGATTSIENKHISKPFTFATTSNNYKNCDSFNWDPSNGWQ
jgi:hypothetical protein